MIEVKTSPSSGKQYVMASQLYILLRIDKPFAIWMTEASFGFKSPDEFAKAKTVDDWFITIEMAKHISLLQRKEEGKMLREYLINVDKQKEQGELLSRKQIMALLELCKVLGLFSVQKHVEQEHFKFFDKPKAWWEYRAKLIGHSADDLKQVMLGLGKKYKSQRQALALIDKYELIRISTLDLFVGLGKSIEFATNIAKTAKELAREIKAEVYDDDMPIDFKTPQQKETITKIKTKEPLLLDNF